MSQISLNGLLLVLPMSMSTMETNVLFSSSQGTGSNWKRNWTSF